MHKKSSQGDQSITRELDFLWHVKWTFDPSVK